ncbi:MULTISPECIES: CBS domain-containing protein [Thermodesulfovibrio]|uniref:PolyA polymerase family protein n=1 Tax=Thermodesulfovibrio yellowstonii (strain ATCC 51303 / DSM 11347 / YP87) TaxID=289376 RepID=B5YGF0_THEYD|nr:MULTISPECIES: CBS domain-containing protein [Thermodesulfovibrio]ACI21719.1 polyA polymerase family protein [Thermodesulfovibrio yellowstonii DSM 11347]MDI6865561.1 CBS domain-containing protein [Thermodesulfovibrio yellowstonii]
MQIITTHLNADFDAIASCMSAKKLYPEAVVVLPGSMERRVKLFFESFHPFEIKKIKEIEPDKVKTLIVVDTRSIQRIGELSQFLKKGVKVHLYDHHPRGEDDIKADFEITEQIGALASLFTEIFRKKNISITPLEATLLCLGIYEETGCLLFPSTTSRDVEAVAYLLKRGANLNIVSQFLKEELSREEIFLLNELLNSLQEHLINGVRINIGYGVQEEPQDISHIAHKVMDIIDTEALFLIIEMQDKILIIGRSNTPQVDVGLILSQFGGGGHWAAGSATLKEMPVTLLIEELLKFIKGYIKPQSIARDLMTTPVISVQWNRTIKEVEEMMTKYGINAIPVLKGESFIGVITRGVVEKAIFHGLKNSKVVDFATTDAYTAEEDTPLWEIEKNMVELNQRFVPILKEQKVVGVITRTDILRNLYEELIRKFKISKPKEESEESRRNVANLMKEFLSEEVYEILRIAGNLAEEMGSGAYLVGGTVRDLLMRRPSPDIDIVVEGDGIAFAHELAKKIDGKVTPHPRFATAKILKEIKKDGEIKRFYIDIATARTEYYESPAALPKVETSSIKKDLYRRDFTINALAVKLNTKDFGLLIDFFGGQRDIKDKKIRVLHNLSFVEDPTRAIRAIRFSEKLGFKISKHTENLIKLAVKMNIFEKLKGPRLYEELILLLKETLPHHSIKRLGDYGLLKLIHPAIEERTIYNDLAKAYETIQGIELLFLKEEYRKEFIYLMVILWNLNLSEREELLHRICAPVNIKRELIENISSAQKALQLFTAENSQEFNVQIYNLLKPLNIETIILMMIYAKEWQKKAIFNYLTKLKDIKPLITGEDLKKLGIQPGPVYRKILESILREKLQGRLLSKEEEIEFAKKIGS